MCGCIGGTMDGVLWINGMMDGCIDEWCDGCIFGWMEKWLDGGMEQWME